MRRPTLEAVAARAGVSRSTVSRVVNGQPTVTPDIRDVVMRAVDELGYVPNGAARNLVTQRTDSVALVVSESPNRLLSDDPTFATVIRAASLELEAAGRQAVLLLTGSSDSHARVEKYIAGGYVDGVMLVSSHGADLLPVALTRLRVPAVSYGRPTVPVAMPYVDNDNVSGAADAVRHLLERGRRRIATIAGPLDTIGGQDRLTGYRDVLRDSDRRSIVAVGDFTRESGAVAMRQLLADDPDLDAVFAANDLMAIGAMRALRLAGRRIPDDVAVVGYDDIEAAGYTDPPLTTVHSPHAEQAAATVRLLLNLFEEGRADSVIMPTKLVVRHSS
ncbi:LacI family DNA-binding transcriptional regulator [Streptosporangium sp. NPDC051022]|uniref:LacI family DNA-binding transcriptional regulator n=1 Tax=Streptosporangium sp. NPDC051022 TaxID=3155752 RepID=UPI00342B8B4A